MGGRLRSSLSLWSLATALGALVSYGAESARHAVPSAPVVSDAQLVGQHLVYGFTGVESPPPWLIEKIGRGEAAGVLIFGSNVASRPQLRKLIATLQAVPRPRAYDVPLFVMVDQEGGQVQRVPGAPGLAPSEVGRSRDLRRVRALGAATGRNLRDVGINVDLAPVVDVAMPGSIMARRGRAYSRFARVVTRTAEAFVDGLRSAAVVPCLKHFPGLGAARLDEDLFSNRISSPVERLRRIDELPFRALREKAPMVMTSTAVYPRFGPLPALLNRALVRDELRSKIGFRGLAIADALATPALDRFAPVTERAPRALSAGNDLLIVSNEDGSDMFLRSVVEKVRRGSLSRQMLTESLARSLELRRRLPRP